VLGYTSQARFLLNCGLPALMAAADVRTRAQAQPLMLEHEMGELFKVIGLAAARLRRRRLRRRRPFAHCSRPRMRWLLVFLIAFLLFNGLQGWLRRIGLGRCPATSFRLGGREWYLPLASSLVLSLLAAAVGMLL
jgi:hypothetical protein